MSKKVIKRELELNGTSEIREIVGLYKIENYVLENQKINCPYCNANIEVSSYGFVKGRRISKCTECKHDLVIEYSSTLTQVTTIELKRVTICD